VLGLQRLVLDGIIELALLGTFVEEVGYRIHCEACKDQSYCDVEHDVEIFKKDLRIVSIINYPITYQWITLCSFPNIDAIDFVSAQNLSKNWVDIIIVREDEVAYLHGSKHL